MHRSARWRRRDPSRAENEGHGEEKGADFEVVNTSHVSEPRAVVDVSLTVGSEYGAKGVHALHVI